MLILATTVNANGTVKVFVNGNEITTTPPAMVVNGSTMIPFRAIFNSLGVTDDKIIWDDKSRSIEVKLNDKYIFLAVSSPVAIVNDRMVMLNQAPFIDNDRTLVPARFIAESLDASVEWVEASNTVFIVK